MQPMEKSVNIAGKQITIIGTSHISKNCADHVYGTIMNEEPDCICIELDEKRYENLVNPKRWEETDVLSVIRSRRVGFLLASIFLSSFQERLAAKSGSQAGDEMRKAVEAANKVGAKIALVDRDIQVTLLRVWRSLTLRDKWRLLITSLDDNDDSVISESNDLLSESGTLEEVLEEMYHDFPEISNALIHERDRYIASKILQAPGNKIVVVIGAAHVPGVIKALDEPGNVEDLDTVPSPKKIGKVMKWVIPAVIIAMIIIAQIQNADTGLRSLRAWVLWNGGLSALFTILAGGHPLAIATAFIAAPITSLNPLLASGWFAGFVQAKVQKPTVGDAQNVKNDIASFRTLRSNLLIKVIIVTLMANVGSAIGTVIGGTSILAGLL